MYTLTSGALASNVTGNSYANSRFVMLGNLETKLLAVFPPSITLLEINFGLSGHLIWY